MSYGRSVQVVVTIQRTALDPETVEKAVTRQLGTVSFLGSTLGTGNLLVPGDTVSSYYTDCPCKVCVGDASERLEYLRGELRAERISYGELAELQGLADEGKIPADDLEMLEAAGAPEASYVDCECKHCQAEVAEV
jgi:hypothetical protein